MKIVNILGGLGNQMFEDVFCCTRSFRGYRLHNGYELKRVFGIDVKEASLSQLAKLAYPFFNYRSWQFMRHCLPDRKKTMTRGDLNIPFDYEQVLRNDSVFYDGYWQKEDFFSCSRDTILKRYSFPKVTDDLNSSLLKQLKNEVSVSCHIRRGDYLKEAGMCVCTPSYYMRAIHEMDEKVKPTMYCIFSDDIAWCRENANVLGLANHKVVFVDWNTGENSYRDMQLMSLCSHNIIANSSFSWWGAWLGHREGRIIMAPHKWAEGRVLSDPICSDWVRIETI